MPRFILLFSDDKAEVDEGTGQELAGAQTLTEVLKTIARTKYRFVKVLFFENSIMHDLGTADLRGMKHEREKDNKRIR